MKWSNLKLNDALFLCPNSEGRLLVITHTAAPKQQMFEYNAF
jgi:hypothetical protein